MKKLIYKTLIITLIALFTVNLYILKPKKIYASTINTSSNGNEVSLTGYLIDEHCFVNKSKDPGIDTKMCLLMKGCIKGGYGIAVPEKDGTYTFYYFNGDFFTDVTNLNGTEGQRLAYDLIKNTQKKDHVVVTVTGKFSGNKKKSTRLDNVTYPVFNVNTIKEDTLDNLETFKNRTEGSEIINVPKSQKFIGYLIDEDCFKYYDNPGDETAGCLTMPECASSGFGIAISQNDGSYKFYYFNGDISTATQGKYDDNATEGQKIAWEFIKTNIKSNNVLVEVTGNITGNKRTNPNEETADGIYYDEINVKDISLYKDEESSAKNNTNNNTTNNNSNVNATNNSSKSGNSSKNSSENNGNNKLNKIETATSSVKGNNIKANLTNSGNSNIVKTSDNNFNKFILLAGILVSGLIIVRFRKRYIS